DPNMVSEFTAGRSGRGGVAAGGNVKVKAMLIRAHLKGGECTMLHTREHRTGPRRSVRLDAVADYVPRLSTGRWWENFEVRAVDVGGGGFQVMTTVPMQVGARLRLIVDPIETEASEALTVQG